MTYICANYPALTVFNPKSFPSEIDFKLDQDKGYCRVSTQMITIRAFPRDKYEYIRNFYFGEADGEYFCNPSAAMITSSPSAHEVTFGYELNDTVSVEGKTFRLTAAPNNNIVLVEV